MIPDYHLPGGFSSTYQRQLYGMDSPPVDSSCCELATLETRRGIFYTTNVFRDAPPNSTQQADRSPQPVVLDTDPLNPGQVVKRATPDRR